MPRVFVLALFWSLACALVAQESRTGDAPVVNPLSSASKILAQTMNIQTLLAGSAFI